MRGNAPSKKSMFLTKHSSPALRVQREEPSTPPRALGLLCGSPLIHCAGPNEPRAVLSEVVNQPMHDRGLTSGCTPGMHAVPVQMPTSTQLQHLPLRALNAEQPLGLMCPVDCQPLSSLSSACPRAATVPWQCGCAPCRLGEVQVPWQQQEHSVQSANCHAHPSLQCAMRSR